MKNKAKSKIVVICFLCCISAIFILVYLIPSHKDDKKVTHNKEIKQNESVTSNIDEKDGEKKAPYLVNYEDLVNAGSVQSENIKDIDNNPYHYESDSDNNEDNFDMKKDGLEIKDETGKKKNKLNKGDKQNSKENKVTVIDESSETMKDETIEYEYKGEMSTNKEFEFFDVKPSGGKEIDGDTVASGEHIGIWN